ncbi:MAG: AGE family epimerase/isomerase [Propionibacteriaceae bacterium]|nr:AGE family epimerase/isomerase [Propionibacteriaceae bacterium]
MTPTWLPAHTQSLVDFALRSVAPEGGFGWMDDDGVIDRAQPRVLWINGRMTHVLALAERRLGRTDCASGVDHGLEALAHLFRDAKHGGWFNAVDWDGRVATPGKGAYAHSFVILASASALAAGHEAALPILRDALDVSTRYFWDGTHQMIVDDWDTAFTNLDNYRGVNSNMHTVEAYLAAAEALEAGDAATAAMLRQRALAICDRVVNRESRANGWRMPEHFDTNWQPNLDYNRATPADQFRPYGATIGHGFEWARLCLQVQAAVPEHPAWLADCALALFSQSQADGWDVDGAPGFVYTIDWDGTPVVHERMHWVLCEAIGAAVAIQKDGLRDTNSQQDAWWAFADKYFIDHERGSWHHELDRRNQPSSKVWQGKPDIYHAIQAALASL